MKIIAIPKTREELKQHLSDPLFKNSYFLMASSLLGAGSGFVFWVLAARFYSVEDVGLASAAISAMSILALLSLMGFDIMLIRFIPESRDKEMLINTCITTSVFSALILSLVFITGFDFWTPALSSLKSPLFFLLFVLFTLFSPLAALQTKGIFVAFRKAEYSFLVSVVTFARILLLPFLISFGAFGIFVAYGITTAFAFAFASFLALKLGLSIKPAFMKNILKDVFHYSAGNYVANVLQWLPFHVLPIIVANTLGAEANAFFYVAWVMSMLLLAIPINVSFSMLAEGSYKEEEVQKILRRALKLIFLLLIPAIIFLIAFGNYILLVFGEEYARNSFSVLRILVLATVPYSVNQMYATLMRLRKDIAAIIRVYFGIAGLTVVMGYFLLKFGIIGVGMAWLFGNSIVSIGILIINYKKSKL